MIDKKKIQHLAQLARIKIEKKEEEKFQKELSSILGYIDILKEADASFVSDFLDLEKCSMREDQVFEVSDNQKRKIKEQFSEKEKNYLKVKSVFK